jgi:hypothetical protein
VRDSEELLQQPKLMHYLQRGWMHGVAAKVAKEVRVFFENEDFHSRPRQQVPEHYARGSAAYDTAGSSK